MAQTVQPPATAQPTRSGPAPARPFGFLLFAVTLGIYLAYYLATPIVGAPPIYTITGDEPHYLTIATSLVRDHDLEAYNNYRDKHYLPFYPHHLGDPRNLDDMHTLYGRSGRVYSKHAVGLPVLIAPAFAWGGHVAAQMWLIVLTAALGVQLFLLAYDLVGRLRPALGAWALGALTSPLLLYADQVYPEVPAALVVTWAARGLLTGRNPNRAALQVGVACAVLPWLHPRYLPLAGSLALALAIAQRRRLRPALGRAAPVPAASGTLLLLFYYTLFGEIPPVDEYGTLSLQNLLNGTLGLLLDQQYGLLTYSPALLVGLYGCALLVSRRPPRWWLIPLLVLPYYTFMASFSWWFGAWSPPSRMLVAVVPLLAASAAVTLATWRGSGFRAFALTTAATSYLVVWQLLAVPRLRYNVWDGSSQLLRYLSESWGVQLVPLWPSFVRPTPVSYVWAAGATGLLVLLGLWFNGRAPSVPIRTKLRLTGQPREAVAVGTRQTLVARGSANGSEQADQPVGLAPVASAVPSEARGRGRPSPAVSSTPAASPSPRRG